jgi:5'-phosphate synthase pdxT subunit
MSSPPHPHEVTVGVLALQGAFNEHVQLLRQAGQILATRAIDHRWTFTEIRTAAELASCDALVIPGGESTTMSLVAERSGVLEPLRDFVK